MNRSKTSQTILTCLQLNLGNAKTKGMRDFAKQQLHDFQLPKTRRPTTIKLPPKQPNWDRYIENEK